VLRQWLTVARGRYPIAYIELAANGSASERIPTVGFGTRLFVDRIAGETELSLYVG